MSVWDIAGAHAGFFTALCSKRVGPSGRVHSFEPAPATRRRLEETVRLNRLDNVDVHTCAVGAERGQGVLYGVGRSAQATMRPIAKRARTAEPVEVRTLSDLWDELGAPDLIKIDAEGSEVAILEGGARVLGTREVTLVVETHSESLSDRLLGLVPVHDRERIDEGHWLLRIGPTPST